MASNVFKNAVSSSIGVSDTTIYTTPATKKSLIIQFDVINTTTAPINVDAYIYNAASSTKIYLRKGVPVAPGYPMEIVLNGKKIITAAGDIIGVTSSAAASANAYVSILEDVN